MSSLMFWRTDWTQAYADDTGNSLCTFPVLSQVCLIGTSSERLLMHEFMNGRTRLLVGYLSPSTCFTTDVTVINETVHCPIMSQPSTPTAIVCGRPSSLAFLLQHSQFVPVQVFLYLCKITEPNGGRLEKRPNLVTFLERQCWLHYQQPF
jgi:hypothetical protein